MLPTRFFKTCRGVFQGGGCRAAALVGAYAMAHQVGVRFAEVAGTSAGSILAALIAAGADPKYIEVAVRDLDFRSLLARSEGPIRHKDFRIIRWFVAKTKYAKYLPAFTHLGMYSSKKLEEWLERKLQELLPQAESPVQF